MNRVTDYINPVVTKKYIFPTAIFIVLALLVWYEGSRLVIHGYTPLEPTDRRFVVVMMLLVGLLYKLFFMTDDTIGSPRVSQSIPPFLQKNVQVLQNRVEGAVNFLRRTRIMRNGRRQRLNYLPWYLLIGAPASGKTTMLANSRVKFILDKQFKDDNIKAIPNSATCDWWVTRDLVLVDVPGTYIAVNNTRLSMTNRLWLSFIDLIHQLRGEQGLSGIVMSLSVVDLMDKEKHDSYLSDLRASIAALKDKFGHDLPFYLTVTKCDLIPGFIDFFNECSSEELAQAWGISLPKLSLVDTLPEVFAKRFDYLLRRLNQQLLLRLHQERNAYARIYIKDFPLQMERLKVALIDVLKKLTIKESFALKGVYLTSAIQSGEGEQTEAPQTLPGDDFQRSLQIMHQPVMPIQSCFIRQFIMHALIPERRYTYSYHVKSTIKRMLYGHRSKQ